MISSVNQESKEEREAEQNQLMAVWNQQMINPSHATQWAELSHAKVVRDQPCETSGSSADTSQMDSKELTNSIKPSEKVLPLGDQFKMEYLSAFNRINNTRDQEERSLKEAWQMRRTPITPKPINRRQQYPAESWQATTASQYCEARPHENIVFYPVFIMGADPKQQQVNVPAELAQPSSETKQEHKVVEYDRSRRSRSRSRGRRRQSRSPKHVSRSDRKSTEKQKEEGKAKRDRPQKFMMKVIFTPLKRILKGYRLKEMGIDMDDYFRIRGEPRGGHRTPADIELVLWYVEQKYRSVPGTYEKFVEYLLAHRRDLEHYGQEAYGEGYPKEWVLEYNRLLKTILAAISTPNIGRARFLSLYTRRPSEQSFHNLRELKSEFYAQGIFPRPESSELVD